MVTMKKKRVMKPCQLKGTVKGGVNQKWTYTVKGFWPKADKFEQGGM